MRPKDHTLIASAVKYLSVAQTNGTTLRVKAGWYRTALITGKELAKASLLFLLQDPHTSPQRVSAGKQLKALSTH